MTALTATIECSRSNPFVLDSARFAPANRRHVSGPGAYAPSSPSLTDGA